jgi:hypothetical protein
MLAGGTPVFIFEEDASSPMGWEIAAVWRDDPEGSWYWMWRRVEDDSGRIIEESRHFAEFEECIEDAQAHGLDHADCVLTLQDC